MTPLEKAPLIIRENPLNYGLDTVIPATREATREETKRVYQAWEGPIKPRRVFVFPKDDTNKWLIPKDIFDNVHDLFRIASSPNHGDERTITARQIIKRVFQAEIMPDERVIQVDCKRKGIIRRGLRSIQIEAVDRNIQSLLILLTDTRLQALLALPSSGFNEVLEAASKEKRAKLMLLTKDHDGGLLEDRTLEVVRVGKAVFSAKVIYQSSGGNTPLKEPSFFAAIRERDLL